MKELVDLFAKLVIGTFSFIGPSFTLIISLFDGQVQRLQLKQDEKLATLISLKTQDKNESLKKQIKINERELNLLKPKRQVNRLFGTLLLSLFFIALFYLQHTIHWPASWNYRECRIIAIVLSIVLFLYALFVLWQVFGTIIDAKLEDEREKKEKSNPLQSVNNPL